MLASVLQIAGLISIAVGVGLFSLPAGIIISGVSCILIGLALERGR